MSIVIHDLEKKLDVIKTGLKEELSKIRTGRVNADLVEEISVQAYGAKMSVKELATIRQPGPSELFIEPWNKDVLEDLEKALYEADLGAAPVATNQGIRLNFPSLTAERRESLLKDLGETVENFKQQIRKARQEARKKAQELESSEGEDFVFRLEENIEDLVKECNEEIKELREKKEKEIRS